MEAAIPNSTCSLGNFINSSLNMHVGGGRRLLPSLLTLPKWRGNELVLKTSIPNKWRNVIPSSSSFRWNIIWHKAKVQKMLPFIDRLSTMQWRWMTGVGEISMELDKSCPHYGPHLVESMKHIFFRCPLVQQVWRYDGTFLPKNVTLVPKSPSEWCNVSLISLCARHWNVLVAFGSS